MSLHKLHEKGINLGFEPTRSMTINPIKEELKNRGKLMNTLNEKLTWLYASIDADLALCKEPLAFIQSWGEAGAVKRQLRVCPAALMALRRQVEWLEESKEIFRDWLFYVAQVDKQLHTLIDSYRKETEETQ